MIFLPLPAPHMWQREKAERENEENKENKENKKRNYIRREFSYQEFNQSYILPDDADREKISAKVENGVLTIDVPKLPAEKQAQAVQSIAIS